ncbi:MAG: hypothetical protein Q4G26_08285 [Paracoccus sp. (in: a-proteobacteria)]|nr:hypothetical protein [Paracoccus sp. (in: a-proteobacteria)]
MIASGLTLIVLPSMPLAPLALMQSLHLTRAKVHVDPLAGIGDAAQRGARLSALCDHIAPQLLVLPAAGLHGLPPLGTFAADARVIRLDSHDPARALLRALRVESWITAAQENGRQAPLPIPESAGFRPSFNANRFRVLLHEVHIGGAILDAALAGLKPRQITVDGPAEIDLGLPGLPPLPATPPEPLSSLTDAAEAEALIRAERLACPGVDLPPLPALTGRARAPVAAFVCGRNILPYLPVIAGKLLDEDVPLIYIDNGSDDGSAEYAAGLIGRGIAELHHLPYDGSFSVEAQLRIKEALIAQYAPHWVLHMDGDEILEHRQPGQGIHDMARDAEDAGYNALNFQEFTFLPRPGEDFSGRDYPALMRQYYLFEPMPYRLIRMWRHGFGLSNLASAGHRLSGPLRLSPVSHNLRHYIALSEAAAQQKYLTRRFAPAELARNWHRNRIGLTAADLMLPPPDSAALKTLPEGQMKAFDRSAPQSLHWWQWDKKQ